MSGYPYSGNTGAAPPNPFGDNFSPSQPYPPSNIPPILSTGYPYPNQQQNMMSSENAGPGYPISPSGPGYPTSPSGPGYPTSPNGPGYQTSPTGPGYQTSPGYPPTSGYPGAGGQTNPGYPGNVPDSGAAVFNPQVCPTAPDMGQMEKIPGYEKISFEQEIIMPPSMPEWEPQVHDRKQIEGLPSLNEDVVREAAIQYVSENCCYGSGAAKNMVITNITMMSAFHYKLETFGEKRESAWRFVPYNGQAIDGPMNGPAPRPWDVMATPSQDFKNSTIKMEVPHTAFVKPCHTCIGNGRVRCDDCLGNGRTQCTWCRGSGRRSNFDQDACTSCNGTGMSRCSNCQGNGQVKCKTCNGKSQLKGFVELVITWTNHIDDYISETSRMPKELVRQVTGQVAFEEEYPRVNPIMHAPDEAVRNASSEYVNKHNSAFPNERILKQRHCLRLVPIGEVNYMWKEKAGLYYVYGYEHKVYFEKYPQKCCCCTIL